MPASRSVTRAVSAVLDLAPRRGEVSLSRLVDAVSEDRHRPIELKMAELPPGSADSGASTSIVTCS